MFKTGKYRDSKTGRTFTVGLVDEEMIKKIEADKEDRYQKMYEE